MVSCNLVGKTWKNMFPPWCSPWTNREWCSIAMLTYQRVINTASTCKYQIADNSWNFFKKFQKIQRFSPFQHVHFYFVDSLYQKTVWPKKSHVAREFPVDFTRCFPWFCHRSIFPLVGLKPSSGFSAVMRLAIQWTCKACYYAHRKMTTSRYNGTTVNKRLRYKVIG